MSATTYGWDTVFGLRIQEINGLIASHGRSPKTFSITDPRDGALAGQFGTWQVTTGGDNHEVRLAVPYHSATLIQLDGTHAPLPDGTAYVKVELAFHPVPPPPSQPPPPPGAPVTHQLRLRTNVTGGVQAATLLSVSPTPADLNVDLAFENVFESWFNAHLGEFDHVFATAILNDTAASGDFQWMMPTAVSYAYVDLKSAHDGILAVLCMTAAGGKGPTPTQQVSADIVSAQQTAGLLISEKLLLSQLLFPHMSKMFAGSHPADFVLSASGDAITNANSNISFQVPDDTGKLHMATLTSLNITITGGELLFNATTKVDFSPGVRAVATTQNFLGIKLVTRADGLQTFSYYESRPSIVDHGVEHDPSIAKIGNALLFASTIGVVIATVLSEGAAFGISMMIWGVVNGAFSATVGIIDLIAKNQAPAITDMVLNLTAPIVWSDTLDFRLTAAALSDSLQLNGTLVANGH